MFVFEDKCKDESDSDFEVSKILSKTKAIRKNGKLNGKK